MQIALELLAPAKNKSIGIAAIDCGADAVYIAGPQFGAREAAGNSINDIAELVSYAHKYGVKVYMVINTILYDNEIKEAQKLITQAYNIGCDAIIVQDLAVLQLDIPPIPLFASTQTNIRDIQQAKLLESLGFKRLILARELSTKQIKEISNNCAVELEGFVHGALCVSYSGQCYLSQKVTQRSANRGCCAQACRSNYTLIDSNNKILAKNEPLLSLKDLNLSSHIKQLVESGITSFKIEGRLKNESYVKNIVRFYREAIDSFIAQNSNYCRGSLGSPINGFTPNPNKTFNRGYTTLFIDEKRGDWKSKDGAKYIGEYIGEITEVIKKSPTSFKYKIINGENINNGDGLCFVNKRGDIIGARANSCNNGVVNLFEKIDICPKDKVYRNYNYNFEKELEKNSQKREIQSKIDIHITEQELKFKAVIANNISATYRLTNCFDKAKNRELAISNLVSQLSKSSLQFKFNVNSIEVDYAPFIPISTINSIRREIAQLLNDEILNKQREQRERWSRLKQTETPLLNRDLTYLANCSNNLSKVQYGLLGAKEIAPAYEILPPERALLMQTKYCIKYQLGICPNYNTKWREDKKYINRLPNLEFKEPLYLINGANKFELKFNCKNCEMQIIG